MKAQELRIGNYILSDGFPLCIAPLNMSYLCKEFELDSAYKPIPLTEDILLKCGFEKFEYKNNFRYSHDESNYYVELHGDKACFVIQDFESCHSITHYVCHSYFLHDFQNAFYSLNKTELTVNL